MSRSHVYVRQIAPVAHEIAAFNAALEEANPHIPSGALSLPATRVMVAERKEPHGVEVIGYQPHYLALVLGSWIPAGGALDTEIASAMHQMTAAAYTRCHEQGLAEILIQSNTPETIAYALRHNYVRAHDTLRLEVR